MSVRPEQTWEGALTGLRINQPGGGAAKVLIDMAGGLTHLATCPEASVGALIARTEGVKGGYILPVAVGWNTSPGKARTCQQVGCVAVGEDRSVVDGHWETEEGTRHFVEREMVVHSRAYSRHIHAEEMAIANAAREGVALGGCWVYVTMYPCPDCVKLMAACGIVGVAFPRTWAPGTEPPEDISRAMIWAEECGVKPVAIALDGVTPEAGPEAPRDDAALQREREFAGAFFTPGVWPTEASFSGPLTKEGEGFFLDLSNRAHTTTLSGKAGDQTVTIEFSNPGGPIFRASGLSVEELPKPWPECDKCLQEARWSRKTKKGAIKFRCEEHFPGGEKWRPNTGLEGQSLIREWRDMPLRALAEAAKSLGRSMEFVSPTVFPAEATKETAWVWPGGIKEWRVEGPTTPTTWPKCDHPGCDKNADEIRKPSLGLPVLLRCEEHRPRIEDLEGIWYLVSSPEGRQILGENRPPLGILNYPPGIPEWGAVEAGPTQTGQVLTVSEPEILQSAPCDWPGCEEQRATYVGKRFNGETVARCRYHASTSDEVFQTSCDAWDSVAGQKLLVLKRLDEIRAKVEQDFNGLDAVFADALSGFREQPV